jgi:ABC-2 type transport system ATP-binding protein
VSAAQLGARLRVLIADSIEDPVGYLRQQNSLSGNLSASASLALVRPSLEDVFVTCTGKRR